MTPKQPATTFSLVCDDCKVAFCCGQGQFLWSPEKVGSFLIEHYGHTLRYLNDLVQDKRATTYGAWKHGVH